MTKVRVTSVERLIPHQAEDVWSLLVDRYGEVAAYSRDLTGSHLLGGARGAVVGCERKCLFDTHEKRYMVEKLTDVDRSVLSFSQVIVDVAGAPLVPHLSKSVFRITSAGSASCTVRVDIYIATRPSFLSAPLVWFGVFERTMTAFLIGLDHYLRTGEEVNPQNYGRIANAARKAERLHLTRKYDKQERAASELSA